MREPSSVLLGRLRIVGADGLLAEVERGGQERTAERDGAGLRRLLGRRLADRDALGHGATVAAASRVGSEHVDRGQRVELDAELAAYLVIAIGLQVALAD